MTNEKTVYGVNLNNPVTPQEALSALIECFYTAHRENSALVGDEEVNRNYCILIIQKAFTDCGADFNHPTKQSLLKVMEKLREFSIKFRDTSIIERHIGEMKKILDKV